MKQHNWDRLREGDAVICKTSEVEYELGWLKRNGIDNRRQYKLTPETRARLRALNAPPADPAPLTADDAAYLQAGDEMIWYGKPALFTQLELGQAQGGWDIRFRTNSGTDACWFDNPNLTIPPATVAAIAQRKASATLAVGDTVEVTGPTIARRTNEIGKRGVVTEHVPADNTYQVDYADRPGIFCGAFPASSLRRVQPAPDVQPAAYVAGQAVVTPDGLATYGGVEDEEHHLVCMPWCEVRSYKALRPCPVSAGCVVMDRQTGEYGIVAAMWNPGELWVGTRRRDGALTRNTRYDPARHTVMLTPRQPAAPAEQPALVPESANRGTYDEVSTTDGTKQPEAPAPDLRREIEAALLALIQDDSHTTRTLMDIFEDTIRAAAAVPPADSPYIETLPGYAKGYNAGQNSILAKLRDALTQGGK